MYTHTKDALTVMHMPHCPANIQSRAILFSNIICTREFKDFLLVGYFFDNFP